MNRTDFFYFDDDRRNTAVRNRCNIKTKRHDKRSHQSTAQTSSPDMNPTSFNPANPVTSFSFNPFVFESVLTSSPSIYTSSPSNTSSNNADPVYPSVPSNFQFQASSSLLGKLVFHDKTRSSKIGDYSDSSNPKTVNVIKEEEESKPLAYATTLQLTLVSRFLKGMPQNPHFYQLRNYSNMVRKNLISGWDRVFGETVEGLHSLQVKDFWVKAKEMWKTMEELQSLGYNVILLRRRLVELTDVMMGMKASEFKILGIKNKAEFHRMEKSRLEFEILKLQGEVKREEGRVVEFLKKVEEIEKELPKFDGVFAALTMKSL